jgi:hypothetical protein
MATDAWERIAELEHWLERARHSTKRDELSALRDLWITLASELTMLSTEQQVAEIEAVESIHSQVMQDVGQAVP